MVSVQYVIGIDFGTDSVRSVIIDAADGHEITSEVADYSRWKEGRYCDPARNQFRQHPLDFIESMEASVREALLKAPRGTADRIVGIGMDTTGSTPAAVDKKGTPLAMTPGFEENPDAMFVLWKDHTAVEEAAEINQLAKTWGGEDFTKYEGGIYSSEWFWSKILHIVRRNPKIQKTAFSWLEHCDWMGALLTGNTDPLTLKRSRCAAGHKAMWHASWNGLPSEDFLNRLDPKLTGLRERLYTETFTSDVPAGTLCAEWASRLGLRKDVQIAVGAFDAHLGAVGAEIKPYTLCKVMGTSTCDMLIAPMHEMGDRLVRGICGQVDGSIIPGMLGMEAGQSAFGDIYAWFRDILMWPLRTMTEDFPEIRIQEMAEHIIPCSGLDERQKNTGCGSTSERSHRRTESGFRCGEDIQSTR
jgi:L-ribulokinase